MTIRARASHAWLRLAVIVGLALLISGCGLLGGRSNEQPEREPSMEPTVGQAVSPSAAGTGQVEALPAAPAAPAPAARQPSGAPARIVEGGLQEPRTLNPILIADPISEELSRLVFNGLVTVDPRSAEPRPDLAESWSVSEDRLTIRFTLREDVLWHDGQPFNAHDVVFTYRLMMNDRAKSPRYSRLVERVRDVAAPDAATVVVTLSRPDASFLTTLATLSIVPEHVLSDVLPEELVADPFGLSSAVGTGPFRLREWSRGEQLVFERNEQYFKGPAAVERYVYRVVPAAEDLVAGLRDGGIDWARLPAGAAAGIADERVRVLSLPSFEMSYVALQLDPAATRLFLDQRVRRALMLALDRERLIEQVWHGRARVAHGTQPPASTAFSETETRYRQDLDEARRLLEEAGWITGDDGARAKDGERLRFALMTNGDNPERRRLVELLIESWREIGVEVVPRYETWSTVREQAVRSRDFEAVLLGFRWDIDPDQTALWSSDALYDGFNLGHYTNIEIDGLLERALAAETHEERARLYAEVQRIVMEELPVLPIAFPDLTVGLGPSLHDVELTAILVRSRANIDAWVPSAN